MQGRLILTTVGTSALNREKLERAYLWSGWQDLKISLPKIDGDKQHHKWLQEPPPRAIERFVSAYIDLLSKEVMADDQSIKEELNKPKRGLTNVLSAEITSLYLAGLNTNSDKVIFLASDSPEGAICCLINAGLLIKKLSITPEIIIIQGLQSENFKDFYEKGLAEFTRIIARCIKENPDKKPVLNATGGFKSLISYATYIALAHDMPLYFVFEEGPEPIWINLGQAEFKPDDREKIEKFQNLLLSQQEQLPERIVNMKPPVPSDDLR